MQARWARRAPAGGGLKTRLPDTVRVLYKRSQRLLQHDPSCQRTNERELHCAHSSTGTAGAQRAREGLCGRGGGGV